MDASDSTLAQYVAIATIVGAAAAALQLIIQHLVATSRRRQTSQAIQDYAYIVAASELLPEYSVNRQVLIEFANEGPLKRIQASKRRQDFTRKAKTLSMPYLNQGLFVIIAVLLSVGINVFTEWLHETNDILKVASTGVFFLIAVLTQLALIILAYYTSKRTDVQNGEPEYYK